MTAIMASNSSDTPKAAVDAASTQANAQVESSVLTTPATGHPTEQLEVEEANTAEDESHYPTGAKFQATLVSLVLSMVLAGLDGTMMTTAIPTITNDFGTIKDIAWYGASMRLTMIAFLFMFCKMYTLMSVKIIYIVSLVIFELGCLLCTVAWSSKVFIVGRAISGLGVSGLLAGIFTMITLCVPLRKRALIGSIAGGAESIAAVAGPLLGGVLTDKVSWRFCFGINLPLGAISIAIVVFFYTDPPRDDPNLQLPWRKKLDKIDLPSTVIFVPAITCLLLALQWGGIRYGWSSTPIIVLFVAFGLALVGFIYRQYRRGEDATLPGRIFRQRSILFGAVFAGLCNAALGAVEFYLVIFFQAVRGFSASKSGLLMLPQIIGLTAGCFLAGAGTTAIGYYVPFMIFSAVTGPIAAGLLTTVKMDIDLASILGFAGLLGFGLGMGIQSPQVAAQTVLAVKDVPIGIGVVSFAQGFGPTILLPAAQAVFQNRLDEALEQASRVSPGGLNITSIEGLGLSDIRHHIGGQKLKDVLLGYDEAVATTMYLPLVLTCLIVFATAGMEWQSVKKKQQ